MIEILVPSRGRPNRARLMAVSALETARSGVGVTIIVDPDDPERKAYAEVLSIPGVRLVVLSERLGYTASLNEIAAYAEPTIDVLGAFGDDVIFRTKGWDDRVRSELATPGIAYGNDLVHGQGHPTAVFMSRAIVDALGWLALPATSHQWADDGWKALGQRTGLLRYLPNVVVEHMHPAVGKAEWDETYASVFDDARAKRDYDGYQAWLADGLEADAEKVLAALA